MKIRSGFVSNSSSSSFIIGFDKVPKNICAMKETLFGEDETSKKTDWSDDTHSVFAIAERVLNDISDKKPITVRKEKKIIEEISGGYFNGYPEYNWRRDTPSDTYRNEFEKKHGGKNINNEEFRNTPEYKEYRRLCEIEREEYDNQVNKAASTLWNSYKATFEGKKIFFVSYSDNDGSFESFMEHGNIFSKIPHIRISHH